MINPTACNTPLHTVSEHLATVAERFREMGWLRPLAHVRALGYTVADEAAKLGGVCRKLYSAEQSDREALKRLAAAQREDSPGGINITPAEAAPIARLVSRSAEADHDASEQITEGAVQS